MSASQEAGQLVAASFGGRLLRTIGAVYESNAAQWLASLQGSFTVDAQMVALQDKAQSLQVNANAVSSVARTATVIARKEMKRLLKKKSDEAGEEDRTDDEDDDDEPSYEESLPVFLQTSLCCGYREHVPEDLPKNPQGHQCPLADQISSCICSAAAWQIFRDAGQVEHSDLSQIQVAKQHLEEAFLSA
eukprot:CAMPEP_0178424848 /NCGR_PEP_ID=MMETSP0689_2-20121128/28422_1 /TAXON_ID=160604 /ORGANISM="Amphidinium massartii, Strain CS-259" /LENGTH=188 /DNA_ID=CAMNT_0020046499 /DNA_START=129 /DNA_END=693 /DNA_ORIENTATION=+